MIPQQHPNSWPRLPITERPHGRSSPRPRPRPENGPLTCYINLFFAHPSSQSPTPSPFFAIPPTKRLHLTNPDSIQPSTMKLTLLNQSLTSTTNTTSTSVPMTDTSTSTPWPILGAIAAILAGALGVPGAALAIYKLWKRRGTKTERNGKSRTAVEWMELTR